MALPEVLIAQTTVPGVKALLGIGPLSTPTFAGLTINGNAHVTGTLTVDTQINTAIMASTSTFTNTLTITGLGTGIAVHTGSGNWVARSLTAPAAGMTITNNDGVSANPTFAFANDLGAIEALNTNGMLTRTGTDTWAARTVTGTANEITVTNGSGVAGNPTLSLPTALTFTGKTVTGGAFTGGTWDNGVIGGTTPAAGTFTTLTATGLVDLSGASAGQIKFPATQNPSADANTLDDYEEGSWTPVLTFTTPGTLSVSYSLRQGRYQKVGNTVKVWYFVQTQAGTTLGTASGSLLITGLPFTALTNMNQYCSSGVGTSGITANPTSYQDFGMRVTNGTAQLGMTKSSVNSGSGHAAVGTADVASPTGILLYGFVEYEA